MRRQGGDLGAAGETTFLALILVRYPRVDRSGHHPPSWRRRDHQLRGVAPSCEVDGCLGAGDGWSSRERRRCTKRTTKARCSLKGCGLSSSKTLHYRMWWKGSSRTSWTLDVLALQSVKELGPQSPRWVPPVGVPVPHVQETSVHQNSEVQVAERLVESSWDSRGCALSARVCHGRE